MVLRCLRASRARELRYYMSIDKKNNRSEKEVFLLLLVSKTYLSEDGKDFYLKCCKNKPTEALSGWE